MFYKTLNNLISTSFFCLNHEIFSFPWHFDGAFTTIRADLWRMQSKLAWLHMSNRFGYFPIICNTDIHFRGDSEQNTNSTICTVYIHCLTQNRMQINGCNSMRKRWICTKLHMQLQNTKYNSSLWKNKKSLLDYICSYQPNKFFH